MSTFNDLFEELLEHKEVIVPVLFSESESLRVSLTRRWKQYQHKMDSLGFLPDSLKNLSLSRESVTVDDIVYVKFLLRSRANRNTYTILRPDANNTPNEDGSGI